MAEGKEYFVRICGASVPVTQEVYQTCYQTKRHAKTLYEKDERHNLVSYDGMDTEDILGAEAIPDLTAPSVEDIVLIDIQKEKLHECLNQLPQFEWDILRVLYFDGLSERQAANRFGLHYMTLHSKKVSILCKLKKMMES